MKKSSLKTQKTLIFSDPGILPYINRLLTSHFEIRKNIDKTNYCCSSGNLNWLKQIFVHPPNNEMLLEIFLQQFSEIELYHTCSPNKLTPYYENGIQPLDIHRIEIEFKKLVTRQIIGYKMCDIDSAIIQAKELYQKSREHSSSKNVCLHIDKRHALNQPSFCFFGGEYMSYIVGEFPDKNVKKKLYEYCQSTGIPTLFIIRLPLDNVMRSNESLMSYIRTLLVNWASRYIYKQHLKENVNYIAENTYNLNYIIDSKFIIRHEHPKEFCTSKNPFYCDKCKKKIRRS